MPRDKKCLETRARPDGIVRRRYLLPDGTKETTFEIPEALIRKVRFLDRMESAAEALDRARAKKERNDRIRSLRATGLSYAQIGKQVGLHAAQVGRVLNGKYTAEEQIETIDDVFSLWNKLVITSMKSKK